MEKTQPITPTTFVQADAETFRELVQKLTGADEDSPAKLPITLPSRLSSSRDPTSARRSGFKLQERRQNIRKLEIKLGLTSLRNSGFSPRNQHQTHIPVSPISSPVTPLTSDTLFSVNFSFSGSESPSPVVSEEEKAIGEKGFFISPLSTPRGADPPELLPLFPLTSPKHAGDQ